VRNNYGLNQMFLTMYDTSKVANIKIVDDLVSISFVWT
jgi:hypothetical protein